jgi:lipopolysaccharide/colanic/teichoic acid biosynthesis glycosyltransferase
MGELSIALLSRALSQPAHLETAGRAAVWPWRGRVRVIRPTYGTLKRIIDLLLCALSLPLVAPLLGLIALAIYVDSPGPVLFRQSRTGKGGRRFGMYKFRTMVPNAEELKKTYAHLNELEPPDFKITNDPRITRVGHLLRRTSLDELPQIVNVLRGEMSLVGPRPTSFDMKTYRLWQTERLEVLPGITGLWQVRGRSDLEFDERVRLDIEYIETRSLFLDLRILLETVGAVFAQRGAY